MVRVLKQRGKKKTDRHTEEKGREKKSRLIKSGEENKKKKSGFKEEIQRGEKNRKK